MLILFCRLRLANDDVKIALWELYYKDCTIGIALFRFCDNSANFATQITFHRLYYNYIDYAV